MHALANMGRVLLQANLASSVPASLQGLSAEDLEVYILSFLETLPPTLFCADEVCAPLRAL